MKRLDGLPHHVDSLVGLTLLLTGVFGSMQQRPFPRHISLMARPTHYVPAISRPVVAVLFHEAWRHRIPMTRLVDHLLMDSLRNSPGWRQASQDWPELAANNHQDRLPG